MHGVRKFLLKNRVNHVSASQGMRPAASNTPASRYSCPCALPATQQQVGRENATTTIRASVDSTKIVLTNNSVVAPITARVKTAQHRRWTGYLAIVPFFIVVALFELAPLAQLAVDSLNDRDSEALGLENFVHVLTTPLNTQSIWNSAWIRQTWWA